MRPWKARVSNVHLRQAEDDLGVSPEDVICRLEERLLRLARQAEGRADFFFDDLGICFPFRDCLIFFLGLSHFFSNPQWGDI